MTYQELIYLIKELIEKSIPKPPKYDLVNENKYWYCPKCGDVVLSILKDSPIENEYNHDYCGRCGQRIKWRN